MTQFIFKENIAGSSDGINVVEYAKGDKVEKKELSDYLAKEWLKAGIIEILKSENEDEINSDETETETEEELEEIPEEQEEPQEEDANTGDQAVDDFLNGETDEVPEGTEEISEEEALILEAKEILKSENEDEINSERLKEIGIALNIPKMSNTINLAKIIEKMNKFIEDYEAGKEE